VRNSANDNVEKEDVGSSGSDELEPTGGSSDHRPVRSPNAVQANAPSGFSHACRFLTGIGRRITPKTYGGRNITRTTGKRKVGRVKSTSFTRDVPKCQVFDSRGGLISRNRIWTKLPPVHVHCCHDQKKDLK
jgi:hypothetical protein